MLASPELDRDEATARRAADLILDIHCRILNDFCELELMDRALGESEPVSNRAHKARARIRGALAACEKGIGATSDARDALVFHWKRATPPPVDDAACA